MSVYAEWCDELEAALAEPFPMEVRQNKRMGGQEITFVSWTHYVERLNRLVGAGGWEVGEVNFWHAGDKLVMAVPVTILGVTKVNVGDEGEDKDDFGTAATNAYAQALKRTLALFGMGLRDLYIEKGKTRPPKKQAPAATDASRKKLAGLVEELDKAGLTGDDAKTKTRALNLALNGGPQDKVDAAIAWCETTISELETV